MKKKELAQYLDLANHHPNVTPQEIKELCQRVKRFDFHAVFVNPCYVPLAREIMADGIVGTVISFPLGQETQNIKVLGAIEAAKQGADELDVAMNVGLFKGGKEDQVLAEMEAVITAAKNIKGNVLLKFIIETGFLTEEEIKKASQLVLKSGADFVKTNSGWGPRGASLKDVEIIRKTVGGKIKIKVAGGIHTYHQALAFIKKGADRIGTSKAVEIIKGAKK
jgi:deoxyribose-phosphate aldolase